MSEPRPIITLTCDFGFADGTIGAMIGVIKSICRDAEVIVSAADIPPQDIPRGAWALYQAMPFFPDGTIHVAVVDPGVGSGRRAVAAATARSILIGPDNGVLSWAAQVEGDARWYLIENPSCRRPSEGVTFDGRDLFAPTAAALALGMKADSLGPEITGPVRLDWPGPQQAENEMTGEILVADTFGNLISNIPAALARRELGAERLIAAMPGGLRARLAKSYEDITETFGMVVNGSGLLEVAAFGRSASELSGLSRGARIVVKAEEKMP